jgi:hypothetical protein
MVRTFLKVYMELGSYFLFLQEQIKDIIIITDRMRDVHMLHHTQSVPMLDETSALHGNMAQNNNEEDCKQPRLSFSPAESVWGQMGRAWTTGCRSAPRTTEAIAESCDLEDSVPQWGDETSLAGQWLPAAGGDGAWAARTGSGPMLMRGDIFAASRCGGACC